VGRAGGRQLEPVGHAYTERRAPTWLRRRHVQGTALQVREQLRDRGQGPGADSQGQTEGR
jgi:hypothetical protein